MAIRWTLKKWLAVKYDIYRAADLKRRLAERTGVQLSHQALSNLLETTPKLIRLSTMQVLCTTFQCELSEFFQITPGKARRGRPRKPYAAHGKRKKQPSEFPSPDDFQPTATPSRHRKKQR